MGAGTLLRHAAKSLKHKVTGHSDSWWDHQPEEFKKLFLQAHPLDGMDHPSRQYMRDWLTVNPDLTLLDVPCGPGAELDGFLKYKTPVKYIGLDQSDTMLEVCRSKHPNGDFRRGSIFEMPFADHSIDVVLCRHILEHLDDYRPAVLEAIRSARKHVFIILFRAPTKGERKQIGVGQWKAWDNRIDMTELSGFLLSHVPDFHAKEIPYNEPVLHPRFEVNTVLQIDL